MTQWKEPDNFAQELINQQLHDSHFRNLQEIKPSIDNNEPSILCKEKKVAKYKYNLEKREKDIEHENNILLQKIFNIISSNKVVRRVPGPRSLNLVTRRREIDRINESNRRMVLNLMDIKPTYKYNDFQKHHQVTQDKLRLVSKFQRQQYKSAVVGNFKERNGSKKSHLPNIHEKSRQYDDDEILVNKSDTNDAMKSSFNNTYNSKKSKKPSSVDNTFRNKLPENATPEDIKAIVEEQIRNYEESGDYMEAQEYRNKLDGLIAKYRNNEEELKQTKAKTKGSSKQDVSKSMNLSKDLGKEKEAKNSNATINTGADKKEKEKEKAEPKVTQTKTKEKESKSSAPSKNESTINKPKPTTINESAKKPSNTSKTNTTNLKNPVDPTAKDQPLKPTEDKSPSLNNSQQIQNQPSDPKFNETSNKPMESADPEPNEDYADDPFDESPSKKVKQSSDIYSKDDFDKSGTVKLQETQEVNKNEGVVKQSAQSSDPFRDTVPKEKFEETNSQMKVDEEKGKEKEAVNISSKVEDPFAETNKEEEYEDDPFAD